MHVEAKQFLESIAEKFPDYFENKRVIDIGAGDVNGNNRYLFKNCEYVGVDVLPVPNVDIVSKTKDLPEFLGQFDTVISSECFEHDMQIYDSLHRILRLLKPGGLFVATCAGIGRAEHGTKRTCPYDSYSALLDDSEWYPNYYQNLSMDDITKMIPLEKYFDKIYFEINKQAKDLYFYGFRNNNTNYQEASLVDTIFNKHDTDKNSSFHNYNRQYREYLEKYRFKNIKLLEIGVFNGNSIRMWRELFPNATCIVGLDINPHCKNYESKDDNIFVEIGDASNRDFIEFINTKYGPFDLIIDDGSHRNSHVINSFESLFPLMNDSGLYIVEDTICFKAQEFIDNAYPNHLDYFTKFLPYLNQWRYDSTEGIRDHCIDPFKIMKKTENVFEYSIDKIDFGCSFIAIHKLIRNNWK